MRDTLFTIIEDRQIYDAQVDAVQGFFIKRDFQKNLI